MDKRYVTLQTLANIVRDTPHPTHYLCTPREMILHSVFDWDLIHTHLNLLASDGLVSIVLHADNLQFAITETGLDKVKADAQPEDDRLHLLFRKEPVAG